MTVVVIHEKIERSFTPSYKRPEDTEIFCPWVYSICLLRKILYNLICVLQNILAKANKRVITLCSITHPPYFTLLVSIWCTWFKKGMIYTLMLFQI